MPELHTRREAASVLLGASVALAAASAEASSQAARPNRSVRIDARPAAISIELGKTALIVVDMQNDFGSKDGMFDRAGIDIKGIQAVVPAVRSAVASARAAELPIIYLKMAFRPDLSDAGPPTGPNLIKHAPLHVGETITTPDGRRSRVLIRDTWNTDIIPELKPGPKDAVVYKSRFSGFHNPELHDLLQRRGIQNLIFTGCTTSVCVESTVRDAMFHDYRCVVLEDCTAEPIGATESRTNHQASLLVIQTLFGWVSDSQKLKTALALA